MGSFDTFAGTRVFWVLHTVVEGEKKRAIDKFDTEVAVVGFPRFLVTIFIVSACCDFRPFFLTGLDDSKGTTSGSRHSVGSGG